MSVAPNHFKQLRELSRLFEQGIAKPQHMQQLAEILSLLNQHEQKTEIGFTDSPIETRPEK
jgi:Asp-tRNA(Asn)/Glu-tRNA(Gln) amidotransferase C subunit